MFVPNSVPHESTGLRSGTGHGRSHMDYGAAVYGWGQGFLDQHEIIKCPGAVLSPQVESFFNRATEFGIF